MNKKMFLIVVAVWFCSSVAWAGGEFWSTNTFQFPWRDGARFLVIPELRISDPVGFYYFQTYLGPSFVINKDLKCNLFYTPKMTRSGDAWTLTHTGYADFVYSLAGIGNRSRLEQDGGSGTTKYRHQLQYKKNGWILSDEIFYNARKGVVDENRLSLGYAFKLSDKQELTIGLMGRSQKSTSTADWTGTGILNCNLSVTLP